MNTLSPKAVKMVELLSSDEGVAKLILAAPAAIARRLDHFDGTMALKASNWREDYGVKDLREIPQWRRHLQQGFGKCQSRQEALWVLLSKFITELETALPGSAMRVCPGVLAILRADPRNLITTKKEV